MTLSLPREYFVKEGERKFIRCYGKGVDILFLLTMKRNASTIILLNLNLFEEVNI